MGFFIHKKNQKKDHDKIMYNWEGEVLHSASQALLIVAATPPQILLPGSPKQRYIFTG